MPPIDERSNGHEPTRRSGEPLVSVVLPNYNYARYLPERIESILAQSFDDFELIILDDASTDRSVEVIDRYRSDPRVRVVVNNENSGSVFRQWNSGVELARGRYVWIAEADDLADPSLLATLVPILESSESVVLAYSESWLIDETGERHGRALDWLGVDSASPWSEDFVRSGIEECRRSLLRVNTIPNASAVVFRRDRYNTVGGADESFVCFGDWAVWVRMVLGGDIAFVAEPLNHFRRHDSTVRGVVDRDPALTLRELEKVAACVADVPELESPWPATFAATLRSWAAQIVIGRTSATQRQRVVAAVGRYSKWPRLRLFGAVFGLAWRVVTRPAFAWRHLRWRMSQKA